MQGMDERRGSGFGGLFDTRQLTLSSAWLWIRTWNGRGRGRRRAERLVAGCARLGYSARQDASPPPSASAPTRRAPGPAALACIRLRAPSVSVRSLVVHSGLPHRPSPASIAGSRSPRRRGRRRRRRRRRRQRPCMEQSYVGARSRPSSARSRPRPRPRSRSGSGRWHMTVHGHGPESSTVKSFATARPPTRQIAPAPSPGQAPASHRRRGGFSACTSSRTRSRASMSTWRRPGPGSA